MDHILYIIVISLVC